MIDVILSIEILYLIPTLILSLMLQISAFGRYPSNLPLKFDHMFSLNILHDTCY